MVYSYAWHRCDKREKKHLGLTGMNAMEHTSWTHDSTIWTLLHDSEDLNIDIDMDPTVTITFSNMELEKV